MKVDSKQLITLFDDVKALLDGIDEIFRDGEYVQEGINSIAENIKQVIGCFTIDHLTPVTKPTKQEHYFLTQHTRLHDKAADGRGLSPQENVTLFKARFYLFLNRELPKHELPINVTDHQLALHIESYIIPLTPYDDLFKTAFVHDMYRVLDLVAKEIIEQRRKHPQIIMSFDKPITEIKSKSLIDIIT